MKLSTAVAPIPTDEGLKRKLVPRQIAMMAIGSAIGVGLLLGSSVTIRLAGPGVIVTYFFGALIAMVMGYALAEMAVVHPVAGSGDRRGGDRGRHLFHVLVSRRAAVGVGGRDGRCARRGQHRARGRLR